MKICPKCHTENLDIAKFCEGCGFPLADVAVTSDEEVAQNNQTTGVPDQGYHGSPEGEQGVPPQQFAQNGGNPPNGPVPPTYNGGNNFGPQGQPPKKKASGTTIAAIVVGSLVLLALAGSFLFFLLGNSSEKEATQTTETSVKEDVTKYDKLVAEAKQLTIDGKYKDSEKKLATIPMSDLSKKEFSAVKDAVESLNEQNTKGIDKQEADAKAKTAEEQKKQEEEARKAAEADAQAKAQAAAAGSGGFTGDLAKWSNTYTFYYNQSKQKQSSLTISANGGVTQNNTDGTQYFGKASITTAGGTAMSYVTNAQYPSSMPDTKTVHPNVKITVTWDNGGGTQVFYGYLSYSSRLALTDGIGKGGGVNEVWITY